MKLLAIDAGNTRIKWGLADAQGWVRQSSLETRDAAGLGDLIAALERPDRIVISNVAGATVRGIIASALAPFQAEPSWVVAQAQQCGVRSGYADPAQLGSDRWAALIGAWHLFQRSCAVVNLGTTLTVDALSEEGVFLGGIIVPGPDLMRAALAQHTAQLQIADGAFRYFPDETADAIVSGAVNALAGSVERMVRFMQETGQCTPLIVLSGGGGRLIASQLNAALEFVDNLVLEGLRRIALDKAADD